MSVEDDSDSFFDNDEFNFAGLDEEDDDEKTSRIKIILTADNIKSGSFLSGVIKLIAKDGIKEGSFTMKLWLIEKMTSDMRRNQYNGTKNNQFNKSSIGVDKIVEELRQNHNDETKPIENNNVAAADNRFKPSLWVSKTINRKSILTKPRYRSAANIPIKSSLKLKPRPIESSYNENTYIYLHKEIFTIEQSRLAPQVLLLPFKVAIPDNVPESSEYLLNHTINENSPILSFSVKHFIEVCYVPKNTMIATRTLPPYSSSPLAFKESVSLQTSIDPSRDLSVSSGSFHSLLPFTVLPNKPRAVQYPSVYTFSLPSLKRSLFSKIFCCCRCCNKSSNADRDGNISIDAHQNISSNGVNICIGFNNLGDRVIEKYKYVDILVCIHTCTATVPSVVSSHPLVIQSVPLPTTTLTLSSLSLPPSLSTLTHTVYSTLSLYLSTQPGEWTEGILEGVEIDIRPKGGDLPVPASVLAPLAMHMPTLSTHTLLPHTFIE